MAMDFFEHQDRARRNTVKLMVLFVLATVGITTALYFVAMAAMNYGALRVEAEPPGWWDPRVLLAVTAGTLAIVLGGTAYKIAALRGGGRVVAESLGARLVAHDTTDLSERKVLNVVEEMAIASGVAVPAVYVMDREAAINAFAAGHSVDDAVVCVTRGTMELLSRDELQGVVAHEFSHILNGDMRLNIRLIGVIYGILVIGLIGQMLMRSALVAGPRRRSDKEGGGRIAIVLIGAAVFVIGSIGVLVGKLIKAAISRQREFLADASAVQFTRNPEGIGGALKKIGGYSFGSKVGAANAEEASHMFFSDGVERIAGFIMATHPPLPQRIARIDPQWDGTFPEVREPDYVEQKREAKLATLSRPTAARAIGLAAPLLLAAAESARAVQAIGQPGADHLAYAHDLVAAIPDPLKAAAREPYGARALIYALLLSQDAAVGQRQMDYLRGESEAPVHVLTQRLLPHLSSLDPNARLPLIDMAIPALRSLAAGQYQEFRRSVLALMRADERLDLFEWALGRIIMRHMDPHFAQRARPQAVQFYSLKPVAAACATLLSALAYLGHEDDPGAAAAFASGVAQLGGVNVQRQAKSAVGFDAIDAALDALDMVSPREKRRLLNACAACIAADRQITVREGEMLRAVADALSCPMPPLLPGQPLA
ncbi:MAG: M48 family metallopeptidase [Phycisphaeraceae bacterium]